jgi:hypothetical protein
MSAGRGWLTRTLVRVLTIGPLVLSGPALLYFTVKRNGYTLLYDFRGGLYNGGAAILHGHNPYQAGFLAHQAAIMHVGGVALGETVMRPFSIPVYPAIADLLSVPFALLPFWLASLLYTALSVLAMVAGLRLLGVRDWRCLVLSVISWPFLFGLFLGAIGPFLVLGVCAAWRWRERLWPPAVAIASVVAVKIFPWTLGVWLLVTRRYKALALTAAVTVGITLVAWAVIGFAGMAQYPQMLSNMSFIQDDRAVSIVGLLLILGVPSSVATAAAFLAAGGILLGAWRLAAGPDGDRRAFGLALLAALSATPIVWEHYMVLLFVPIALVSPQFSPVWLIPVSAPLIEVFSRLIPGGRPGVPFTTESLRATIPWLLLEVLTGVVICTTPEQRRAFRRRLVPRLRWSSAKAAAPSPAGVESAA